MSPNFLPKNQNNKNPVGKYKVFYRIEQEKNQLPSSSFLLPIFPLFDLLAPHWHTESESLAKTAIKSLTAGLSVKRGCSGMEKSAGKHRNETCKKLEEESSKCRCLKK